jgi:hypothetical protein
VVVVGVGVRVTPFSDSFLVVLLDLVADPLRGLGGDFS